MPKKIAFIGAGSVSFTRSLVRDILTFPAFQDCTLALMDINADNLEEARLLTEAVIKAGNYPAKILATLNRAEALEGADGVLTTIRAETGVEPEFNDMSIMKKAGISIAVGDTRGPTGIFRFLRHFPAMMDIVRDMEKYCPNAVLLNYTNPMAMLCRGLQEESKLKITGLCHSVQQTVEMLADWIGKPNEEMTYVCAGINHQAHYLKLEWNGQDAYPLVRKAILENPEIYNEEPVRNEMFLHLGYYVTESSGHNSEYNPWFRKRPDLFDKYFTPYAHNKEMRAKYSMLRDGHWNPGQDWIERYHETIAKDPTWYVSGRRKYEFGKWINGGEIDLKRGREYAANIFNAVFGDHTPYKFNGNVRNFGCIDNLPEGCCVEVPVVATRNNLEAVHVGPLPPQLAILNNINARIEDMAVEAALTGNKELIYQACLFDPLTSAQLSMGEIHDVVDQLFVANEKYLSSYHFK